MTGAAFLMLEGIRGNSRTAPCIGWIPISSFSFDQNPEHRMKRLYVIATHGPHSSAVHKAYFEGRSIPRGEIAVIRKGQKAVTLKMTDVFVTAVSFSRAAEASPIEQIGLDAGTMEATFAQATALHNPATLQQGWRFA